MKKRIFVGMPLSAELQERIGATQLRFKKLPLRFIRPHNLHVTFLPPWPEENVAALVKKFSAWKPDFSPVEGRFEKLEYGPDSRQPRLIWISGPTPQTLIKLQKSLAELFDQKLEKRPLCLHVTVARLCMEELQPLSFPRLPAAFRWQEHFRSVVLYESKLLPRGSEYTKIFEIEL